MVALRSHEVALSFKKVGDPWFRPCFIVNILIYRVFSVWMHGYRYQAFDKIKKPTQTQHHIQIQGQVFYLLVKPIKHCLRWWRNCQIHCSTAVILLKPFFFPQVFLSMFHCISFSPSNTILCEQTKRVRSLMSLHGHRSYFWTTDIFITL